MSTGTGSESRILLGIVIFSGVLMTTLMTLFVVPVVYKLMVKSTGSPQAVTAMLKRMQTKQDEGEHTPPVDGLQV